jgi:hypothetical protein
LTKTEKKVGKKIKTKKNVHLIGFTITDSPGAETLIIIASSRPLNLVYGDDKAPEVYRSVNTLIEKAGIKGNKNERGLLIRPKDLPSKVGGSESTGSSADGTGSIYISKWVIPHVK